MYARDPQYEEDVDRYLGEELLANRLEDGTVVSRVYRCKACDGLGGADWSRDCEAYDDWHECDICDGSGEIEV